MYPVAWLLTTLVLGASGAIRNQLRVSEGGHKTLCPVKAELNTNEERIPRDIWHMTCANQDESQDQCATGLEQSLKVCCANSASVARRCVQLFEFVPVRYVKSDGSEQETEINVPFGCACVASAPSDAVEISRRAPPAAP